MKRAIAWTIVATYVLVLAGFLGAAALKAPAVVAGIAAGALLAWAIWELVQEVGGTPR